MFRPEVHPAEIFLFKIFRPAEIISSAGREISRPADDMISAKYLISAATMVVFYKKWQKLQKALHTKVAQTSFGNAPQSWNLAKS